MTHLVRGAKEGRFVLRTLNLGFDLVDEPKLDVLEDVHLHRLGRGQILLLTGRLHRLPHGVFNVLGELQLCVR